MYQVFCFIAVGVSFITPADVTVEEGSIVSVQLLSQQPIGIDFGVNLDFRDITGEVLQQYIPYWGL